jgi:hypothetical protein
MVCGIARTAGPAALRVSALSQIGFDDLTQKIARFVFLFGDRGYGFAHVMILGCYSGGIDLYSHDMYHETYHQSQEVHHGTNRQSIYHRPQSGRAIARGISV